jgi:putative N6-adenine-specific DNA methylase
VNTTNPDVRIHAFIRGTRCTISLDSSGDSLHERGYRSGGSDAPLKETLAAAMLMLSGWDPETPLIDPMCGSGTILIEGAMLAMGIPPGMGRRKFGFMRWPDFDRKLWEKVLADAGRTVRKDRRPSIFGFDANPESIKAAKRNAAAAGVGPAVSFESRTLQSFILPVDRPGTLIVNPPYGKRLVEGGDEKIESLYKTLGDTFKQKLKGWTACIFTGNLEMAKHVGLRTSKRTILFNGPMECRLLRYEMY